MKSKFDYRALEDRAAGLQAQVTEIHAMKDADGNIPEHKRDELMRLMGEIHALEDTAGEMKDAELAELRDIVARGQGLTGAGQTEADRAVEVFNHYLKTGEILDASLSTTDANGGYIVPEPKHAELIEAVRKADPVFGNATLFRMTGDTVMQLPTKATHGAVANAAETGARSEQDAPTFTSPTLTCYDYYSDQRATQQWVDSVAGAEDMLIGWMAEDIQEQAGADAVIGDGSTKIKGIFAEVDKFDVKLSGSAGAITNQNFLDIYFDLPVKFRKGAAFIMEPGTLAVACGMAYPNLTNTPLVDRSGDVFTIMGKRVLESDSAPAIGAANHPIFFGDIKAAYAVGIHRNTSVLRDPYTATPKIRYYGLARMGGCAWNYQAGLLLKSNNL